MIDRGKLIVWRVLSWKYLGGGIAGANIPFKRQYQFDDLVVEDRVPGYFQEMQKRGIEYMKFEKKGTLDFVMSHNLNPEPRPGAKRLSAEKFNTKIDSFVPICEFCGRTGHSRNECKEGDKYGMVQ